MSKEYLIVDNELLPKCFKKVIEAKSLLNNTDCNISSICKKCGISRSTFYKYQDKVFLYKQENKERKLVLSLTLFHKPGALSKVCEFLFKENVSIITISQSVPLKGIASLILSLDISDLNKSIDEFKNDLKKIDEIKDLRLISYE